MHTYIHIILMHSLMYNMYVLTRVHLCYLLLHTYEGTCVLIGGTIRD